MKLEISNLKKKTVVRLYQSVATYPRGQDFFNCFFNPLKKK